MKKIAIVLYSGTGNTELMAEAVLTGATSALADARIIHAQAFTSETFDSYDAFAFGCPAMGVEELEQDEFEPMFASLEDKLKDRGVALFGSYGWGDGEWMINWQNRVLSHGANLVDAPVIANDEPDAKALEACKALGRALAR
ncbi:MAG: flavodoxin [Sphaerochaeta sp.]|nr:flavodoxin [Sphaerochaeta sp.]